MRWSYKTVHYELKKEGILGSTFLDESEVELSLNEYGKSGWELVSMLETMDGLIAVFKQPLSLDGGYEPALAQHERPVVRKNQQGKVSGNSDGDTAFTTVNLDSAEEDEVMVVEDFDVVEEEKSGKQTLKDADIGSIVIE